MDARCLALTGSDQHGRWLPLYLRAYDDYREAIFTYLALPLVMVLPKPLIALRLLAVLIGLGTVWVSYCLGRRLFGTSVGLWSAL